MPLEYTYRAYVIQSGAGDLYVGFSNNPSGSLTAHNQGKIGLTKHVNDWVVAATWPLRDAKEGERYIIEIIHRFGAQYLSAERSDIDLDGICRMVARQKLSGSIFENVDEQEPLAGDINNENDDSLGWSEMPAFDLSQQPELYARLAVALLEYTAAVDGEYHPSERAVIEELIDCTFEEPTAIDNSVNTILGALKGADKLLFLSSALKAAPVSLRLWLIGALYSVTWADLDKHPEEASLLKRVCLSFEINKDQSTVLNDAARDLAFFRSNSTEGIDSSAHLRWLTSRIRTSLRNAGLSAGCFIGLAIPVDIDLGTGKETINGPAETVVSELSRVRLRRAIFARKMREAQQTPEVQEVHKLISDARVKSGQPPKLKHSASQIDSRIATSIGPSYHSDFVTEFPMVKQKRSMAIIGRRLRDPWAKAIYFSRTEAASISKTIGFLRRFVDWEDSGQIQHSTGIVSLLGYRDSFNVAYLKVSFVGEKPYNLSVNKVSAIVSCERQIAAFGKKIIEPE